LAPRFLEKFVQPYHKPNKLIIISVHPVITVCIPRVSVTNLTNTVQVTYKNIQVIWDITSFKLANSCQCTYC